jgi:hypothetical protein
MRSSKGSSSQGSTRQAYIEQWAISVRGAEVKSCQWPCDTFMIGAGIKEKFDQYIENAELTAFLADKFTQHYHLTNTFTKKIKYHSSNSRVLFDLYEHSYSMSLEEFCDACKLPYWGSLAEPRKSNHDTFLSGLYNGEDRGVTQARIKSIQFAAIHYFATFNRRCVVGKHDCSALCAPDLSIIHAALHGSRHYNFGVIIAWRLSRNVDDGDLYGGIYALA